MMQPTASATLSLLRFSSPALPIGGYAYSRGLEQAVHAGDVHDEPSAQSWILGLMAHSVARLDAPLFLRLHAAFGADDGARAEALNAWLYASRESAELRLEETQMGAALARLLVSLGVTSAQPWAARHDACYATLYALASVHHGVPRDAALLGYLWALTESQTSAAVRLVPLGQTSGQRLLSAAVALLPDCARQAASIADTEIGATAPAFAIASALHETQYTRLFRS